MDTSHAITINGVTLWEQRGSGKLSSSNGKMAGHRLFVCAWDDRADAIKALLGYNKWIEGELVVFRPDEFPGFTFLKALDLDCEGVGAVSQDAGDSSAMYEYARLSVGYRLPDSPADGTEQAGQDSFDVTETESWRGEYVTIPEGGVHWSDASADAGKPVLEKQIVPIGLRERRFMRRNLTALPRATIDACINRVNNATFKGAAQGKLMFVGCESQKKVDAEGTIVYDVTFIFLQRSVEWNKAWSVGDGAFMYFHDKDGEYVFDEADFSTLQTGTS